MVVVNRSSSSPRLGGHHFLNVFQQGTRTLQPAHRTTCGAGVADVHTSIADTVGSLRTTYAVLFVEVLAGRAGVAAHCAATAERLT